LWLHSLKVAQLLRSAACLHTNQSRSYLNHLVTRRSSDIVLAIVVRSSFKVSATVIKSSGKVSATDIMSSDKVSAIVMSSYKAPDTRLPFTRT